MRYYHKTYIKNVKSILLKGLLLEYSRYNRIYLCRFPDMDMGLGKALFAIDIPDNDPELHDDGEEWEIHAYKDIPPEWINYLGNYGPNEKPNPNIGDEEK